MYILNMTINSTHTVYLPGTREVIYRILFVTGGARWSPPYYVCPPDLCTCAIISHRCFRVEAAGVRDRLHHLDRSVLMNILIILLNARACWVSSRLPFSEINMKECGRGGKALQQGRRFPLMHRLSLRRTNLNICVTYCHVFTMFYKIAIFCSLSQIENINKQ